jgi:hypothetical protein
MSDVSQELNAFCFRAKRKKIALLDPDDKGANFLSNLIRYLIGVKCQQGLLAS